MTTSEPGSPPASRSRGLSIGEIARLAGVTSRAVRHYHATGLLPEPARDSSGYRRYQAADLVTLVRIARLRALGMPVPQIAGRITAPGQAGLAADLRALAGELQAEIERLSALRARLLDAARQQALDDPARTLAAALREFGRLEAGRDLAPPEAQAAALVDALHPLGIAGALDAAGSLLTDPGRRAALDGLLQRYRALTDDSPDGDADALARDVAAILPRPEVPPRPVPVEAMDNLLGGRLSRAQRRFLHQLRATQESGHD
jgi:DNA-binding transcriptional MerR regulator